jgi:hypothetical protein
MTRDEQRKPRIAPRARRGNALILSVLMLLALTSVGLVSVQQTSADLMVAGNWGQALGGSLTAEAGLSYAMEVSGALLNPMLNLLSLERGEGTRTEQGMTVVSSSTADPNPLSYADGTDPLPVVDPGGIEGPIARRSQQMAVRVDSRFVKELSDVRGAETDSNICYLMFDLHAKAGRPSIDSEPLADSLDPTNSRSIIVEFYSRILSGPTKCSY